MCISCTDYDVGFQSWETNCSLQRKYTLPDGHEIILRREAFQCTEPLFRPDLIRVPQIGLSECAYQSVMKCDFEGRRDLFHNVVLAGGSSLFPGFAERLEKDLAVLGPSTMPVKITAPVERKNSVWIGG